MPTACERFLPAHSPNSWSQPRALLPCRPQKLLPSDTWTAVFRFTGFENAAGLRQAGCSKRPSSKAAASVEARRTLRYVELLRGARTPLAGLFQRPASSVRSISNATAGTAICHRSRTSGCSSPIIPTCFPPDTILPTRPARNEGCWIGSRL